MGLPDSWIKNILGVTAPFGIAQSDLLTSLSAHNCFLPFISSNCQLLLKQLWKKKCVSLFPVADEYSEVTDQASASWSFPLQWIMLSQTGYSSLLGKEAVNGAELAQTLLSAMTARNQHWDLALHFFLNTLAFVPDYKSSTYLSWRKCLSQRQSRK